MIAVLFAVPHESHDFRHALRDVRSAGRRGWFLGIHDTQPVLVAHTGMGLEAAEASTRSVLTTHRPRLLISAGYAGGLDPALPHAAVLLATNYSSSELATELRERKGALLTRRDAVETVEAKAALFRETGASAVDMETSAIAGAADVPLLSIRAISDTAAVGMPVPLTTMYDLAAQRARPWALAAYLASHPTRILPFAYFLRGLPPARAALAQSLLEVLNIDRPF